MVAQQEAAQQAARCFLTLLRDVQSSAAVQDQFLSANTYNRQEWRVQTAGRGHISFELEDAHEPPARKHGKHGPESVSLLSGNKGFSSSSAGLPQHSVSTHPAPVWQ